MRDAGVLPNELTATALAKKLVSVPQADELTKILLEANVFIGQGYYGTVYAFLAEHLKAEELMSWFVSQKYRHPPALGAAIRRYIRLRLVNEAFRVGLAFPFLDAARHSFREHPEEAVAYLSRLIEENFEPQNATYALAICLRENGRFEEALTMFEKALELSTADRRSENIRMQIAEICAERSSH
jgi:tetratricopeptide (TPR) repeat protein